MPDNVALFATVIVLLPMMYLLLAAPAFLLVRLDIPAVGQMMRAMFSGYFLTLIGTGTVGTLAVLLNGRPFLAFGIGVITVFADVSRRRFLACMDARLSDRDPGDPDDARALRRLQWRGMFNNAVQLAIVIVCIPYIATPPA